MTDYLELARPQAISYRRRGFSQPSMDVPFVELDFLPLLPKMHSTGDDATNESGQENDKGIQHDSCLSRQKWSLSSALSGCPIDPGRTKRTREPAVGSIAADIAPAGGNLPEDCPPPANKATLPTVTVAEQYSLSLSNARRKVESPIFLPLTQH